MRLPSFAARTAPSTLPEKMDGETDFTTYRDCLRSLATVNAASFGYAPTVGFVARIAAKLPPEETLTVVDVGAGYGDTLRAVGRRLGRMGRRAHLVGADLNPHAARAAGEADVSAPMPQGITVEHVTQDARELKVAGERPHLIVCSLFAHHLETEELKHFLRFMDGSSLYGFFINDLLRSRFAATSFGWLSTLSARHPYVRHDGPVSFARAFRRADWNALLPAAGVDGARVFLGAPFRLCVEKVHPAQGSGRTRTHE